METLETQNPVALTSTFSVGDFVWGSRIKSNHFWPGIVVSEKHHPAPPPRRDPHLLLISYFGNNTEEQLSWAHPSHLKPFAPNFKSMTASKSLSSKGFKHAVQSALEEIGKGKNNNNIRSVEVKEFLECVRDSAAVNVKGVDALEACILRRWFVGFQEHGSGYRRKMIDELVDKIDLDELVESKEEEEFWSNGIVECGKKKRSMAKLIAEKDLDSGEEDEEKKEVEEVTVGRRERKKSKYLSPPYTYLSGNLVASPKSVERTPRSARSKEDEVESSLFNVDEVDIRELYCEILEVARNAMHLKGNPKGKTVRRFLLRYRSSVYSSGSEFDAYVNKCVDKEVVEEESKEGKKAERRGRKRKDESSKGEKETKSVRSEKKEPKRKMGKEGGNGVVLEESQLHTVVVLGGGVNGKSRDGGNSEASLDLSREPVTDVEASDKQQLAVEGTLPNGSCADVVANEVAEPSKEIDQRSNNNGPIIEVPVILGSKVAGGLEEGKSELKGKGRSGLKKKKKDAEEGKPMQKRKKKELAEMNSVQKKDPAEANSGQKKDGTDYHDPAALMLTFSEGTTLPSLDQLISAYSKYGTLIIPESKLSTEFGNAQVVFVRSADAEKAFNDKAGPYGPPIANYRLRYLTGNLNSPPPVSPVTVQKPPLPYIRKSLERMISSLSGNSPSEKGAGTSEELKPENLVGEMQGLLQKVNKMLSGPVPGTSS